MPALVLYGFGFGWIGGFVTSLALVVLRSEHPWAAFQSMVNPYDMRNVGTAIVANLPAVPALALAKRFEQTAAGPTTARQKAAVCSAGAVGFAGFWCSAFAVWSTLA